MRLRICFHDNCFDGAASAALFTSFYRTRVRGDAEILYRGMAHKPGDVFPEGTFDGDENVVVDFRFSSDPRLTWWFDHHVSAFQQPGDDERFRADTSGQKFFDPTAKSCTRFLARTCTERFGFDPAPYAELIHWGEIIDGALFESPDAAVKLAEPALRLMTWMENNHDMPLTERYIQRLVDARPLAEIAAEPWVTGPLEPIFHQHAVALEVLRARTHSDGGVVTFDVSDDGIETYNKFIPYFLFPACRFVVGVSRSPRRMKISVGSNPWLPRPKVSIAAICERYGGGGHPVVGAVSLPVDEVARAREIAGEIAEELRRAP
ncbi:MAG: hypothetical protein EXR72_22465 [Myxococcales bacterium]|nr:hypothetical protein [Myxococcales bacterium]